MNWPKVHNRLDRAFFSREPDLVAPDLVGCRLVRVLEDTTIAVQITETEAYGDATDLASHAAVYKVARGATMRRTPGLLYVYLSYGVHHCLNVVAHEDGGSGAVLIRAVQPIDMPQVNSFLESVGPGRLARFLRIGMTEDATDVVAGNTICIYPPVEPIMVRKSKRIGITRDAERLWRFYDAGSIHVSPLPRNLLT